MLCLPRNLHFRGSQSAMPATKSTLRGAQSAAPGTRSAPRGSPSAAPATKSALRGSPRPRSLHFEVDKVLCLPRNLHFEVHKAPSLPRNLHFEGHKVLCLPRNSRNLQTSHMSKSNDSLRLSRNQSSSKIITMSKVLHLPRKLHFEVKHVRSLAPVTKSRLWTTKTRGFPCTCHEK